MKKILLVQQYFYPDISAVSQIMGDLLQKVDTEYDITVLTSSVYNSTEEYDTLPNSLGNIKIKRIRAIKAGKKSFIHRIIEYFGFYLGTFFSLRFGKKYDLVISMTTPPLIGFFVTLGLLGRKIPIVHYIQDLHPEISFDMGLIKNHWLIRRLSSFNRFVFKRAARIITIGKYMKRKLQWNYGIKDNAIDIIENWTGDVSFYEPERTDQVTILYSGNLGLGHDFSQLPALLDRQLQFSPIPNWKVIGGGNQFNQVKSVFQDIKYPAFSFGGYVPREEHNTLLGSGHILVIAQKEETVGDILPSKLYSYLAAGRPILYLGTRNSEIAELLEQQKFGVVLESEDDISNVCKYINDLFADFDAYVELCKQISDYYHANTTVNHAAEKFKKIIEKV